MEDSKLKKIVWYKNDVFRWIAVIPGSLLSGLIWLFPLHWILYITLSNDETFTNGIELLVPIERFLSPVVTMMAIILTSYRIAPKHKFNVSLVFSIS